MQIAIQDPFSRFEFGIKAEETRQKYVRRLDIFFDFYNVEGKSIKEKSKNFLKYTKENGTEKITDLIIGYMSYQVGRANKKIISKSAVRNFYKPIKLFCEMNDIVLNWKKIARGLPRVREAANDRAPTLEEMQKLVVSTQKKYIVI